MKFNKEQPIYVQLIEDIKVKIINGQYLPGDKMPSIRDYAQEKMVNPNTVQRCFQELENENYIFSKRGIGYFVNEDEDMIEKLKKSYLDFEINAFIDKMSKLKFQKSEIIERLRGKK